MEIFISSQDNLEAQIRRAINKRLRKVFVNGNLLLKNQAEVLRTVFANSQEFNDIKTKFKGEFGFTDEEVGNLDRILNLLIPDGNEITVSRIKTGPSEFSMILDWVDFKKLKAHEYAQHELTRLDEAGQEIEITDIVSWVEWLEEGATIRGYQFFRPGRRQAGGKDPAAFSRSGEGLMKQSTSNFWTFEPSRVFEKIATDEKGNFLKKGFGILVKRFAK